MKKTISFVVAVALILSLAVTAFAAQPETAEPQACNHVWGEATETIMWEQHSDSCCKKTVITTKVCTICPEISRVSKVTYPNHGEAIADATCDGTTQTHIYKCPNCNAYRYTRWVTCPGAGKSHVTGCFWLPI